MSGSKLSLFTQAALLLGGVVTGFLLDAEMAFSQEQSAQTETPPQAVSESRLDSSRSLKIAMAQIFCLDSDREGNLIRIENAVKHAVSSGADMVCFPETAIYGWVNPLAYELATEIPGKDSQALAAIAQKYQVFLSIGLAEKEGEKLYDSAILLDDTGQLLLKHRKLNIIQGLMEQPYSPGNQVNVVTTRWGKVGLLICADSFDQDVLTRMAGQKPRLLLIPYGWANRKTAWPKHGLSLKSTISHAASSVNCPVVGTNSVGMISGGPWRGFVYGGQSYAIDSAGNQLAKGKDRDHDVVVFTLLLPR